MRFRLAWLRGLIGLIIIVVLCGAGWGAGRVYDFNGMKIKIDHSTGGLLELSYPATGTILKAQDGQAGLLTLGYPTSDFVPMQLESSLSKAHITEDGKKLIITWDKLRPSRPNFAVPGGLVSAQVEIEAAPDGRSVIFRCRVENKSGGQISQILFPDLQDLRPFGGRDDTELRMALGAINPFAGPVHAADRAPFYPQVLWQEYPNDPLYQMNSLRWIDLGSFKGGISIFQKKWGSGERPSILTHRDEADPTSLRLAWRHREAINPNETWESSEFWLTPHPGGWAKGIEVYRAYVQKVNPPRTEPKRIRDGLGFRTAWMIQSSEKDPEKAAFKFRDIPLLAKDAKTYGIDEVVLWCWSGFGHLPIRFRSELGTEKELIDGIRQAREMGVNVTGFINCKNLSDEYAGRYGVPKGSAASWVYHPELIPAMFPFSTPSAQIDMPTDNAIWQADVKSAILDWANRGITSFCWDVYSENGSSPLTALIKDVRKQINDPNASFAGEPAGCNLETCGQALDYTWNWCDYLEAGPVRNVLKNPRINCNIENSARVVKMAFADGLYMNIMPKLPNQPNGTKLIAKEPEVAVALREVAPMHARFLPYFSDGTFIGNSALSKPVCRFVRSQKDGSTGGAGQDQKKFEYPLVHVSGYQLGRKLLVIVLNNDTNARKVTLNSDLGLWLPSAKSYKITWYDSKGKVLSATKWQNGSKWIATSKPLAPLELAYVEIEAKA